MQTVSARAIALSILVGVALAGCTATPTTPPAAEAPAPAVEIDGLVSFPALTASHVETPVDYEASYGMNPPAGGDHWAGWLNCGVYSEPQENERAVHSLEHGAVWITYDPEKVTTDDVAAMRSTLPDTYIVISPYPGLPSPVVASAWGYQVQLTGIDDSRLAEFVSQYWQSPTGPEPGAPCTGGVDGPGLVP